ncbi:MAG: hypothetical protein J6Y82_08655 [Bacteroidales bacterium]|nr:hypothetical protein [Bacteroidales bacterium]
MANSRVRILLDADVLIHFQKADRLSLLPAILPEYECVVLSVVYGELRSLQSQLDRQIQYLKNISLVEFSPIGDMAREYAMLLRRFGRGESACMAYCRFTNNVLGSSNLHDIKEYCNANGITYLTTVDFLYFAYKRGVMTAPECEEFVRIVKSKGSKLPDFDVRTYVCTVVL